MVLPAAAILMRPALPDTKSSTSYLHLLTAKSPPRLQTRRGFWLSVIMRPLRVGRQVRGH